MFPLFWGSRARLQEHEFLVLGGIHSCGTSIVRRGLFFAAAGNERAALENPKPARSGAVCLNKSKRVSKVFRFLSGTSHMHRTISGIARISAISTQGKIMAMDYKR